MFGGCRIVIAFGGTFFLAAVLAAFGIYVERYALAALGGAVAGFTLIVFAAWLYVESRKG